MIDAKRIARFWAKVEWQRNGCWLWVGAKDGCGYGLFGIAASRCERAHRFSYRLAHGFIPDDKCVLHRCDTPACVRPDHLFLGTLADNMRDRNEKLRQARGTRNGRAILTAAQVLEIRDARASGEQLTSIASRFGVAPETVGGIANGRSWRHV